MDFLHHPFTEKIIKEALAEDIGDGDHSTLSTIPEGASSTARCLIKAEGILAGIALAARIFYILDPRVRIRNLKEDGDPVSYGDIVFEVSGPSRSILTGERLVLNFMQRMSGIATMTRKVVKLLEGTSCKVLDTRKTTPLIRHMEKWAVHIGGGTNHRFGLYDMIMIKDNHIDFAGGLEKAIVACHEYQKTNNLHLPIVVETRNLTEVEKVLHIGGISRILLDNMDLDTLTQAVSLCRGKVPTEASGGINLDTAAGIARTGVDYISMGALTHSVQSLDISLKAIS